ncbi:MAG: hypothetical protein WBQ94_15440 [Terracidiphilus sp.]
MRSVDSCCAIGLNSVDATNAFRILAVRAALAARDAREARDEWEFLVECDPVDEDPGRFPAPFVDFFALAAGFVVFFVLAVVALAAAGSCVVGLTLPALWPQTGETAIRTAIA